MKVGHIAIQCAAANGTTGSFLFIPGTMPREPLSPVFGSLAAIYPWLDANGWIALPYDPAAPTGAFVNKDSNKESES